MQKFTIICQSCRSVDTEVDFDGETYVFCNRCENEVCIGNSFDESEDSMPFEIICKECGADGEVDHWYMNTGDTGPVGGSKICCTSCKSEYVIADP